MNFSMDYSYSLLQWHNMSVRTLSVENLVYTVHFPHTIN